MPLRFRSLNISRLALHLAETTAVRCLRGEWDQASTGVPYSGLYQRFSHGHLLRLVENGPLCRPSFHLSDQCEDYCTKYNSSDNFSNRKQATNTLHDLRTQRRALWGESDLPDCRNDLLWTHSTNISHPKGVLVLLLGQSRAIHHRI